MTKRLASLFNRSVGIYSERAMSSSNYPMNRLLATPTPTS